jgi:hypothetical protein
LRNKVLQLKQLLEDEQNKVGQKDAKLVRLEKFRKDFENQSRIASQLQAAAAQTQQNYENEIHVKDDKIRELEERCQHLEQDIQKYRFIAEQLREESKEAQDHIRYSRLQKRITELEKSVADLKTRRRKVRDLLNKAEDDRDSLLSGPGDGSRKGDSKITREAEARVVRLDEEDRSIREALKKMEPQLAKLRAEFKGMPNPADFAGDLGPHSNPGSYETQYDPIPDLITDMSSLASGSPPQSESLDTMDTFIMERDIHVRQSNPNADPWAKTVEPSKGLPPRGSEPFARPTGRQKKGPCR